MLAYLDGAWLGPLVAPGSIAWGEGSGHALHHFLYSCDNLRVVNDVWVGEQGEDAWGCMG